MLQVLFTEPQYLTRVQEFVNVRLNSRTECYLPNWVQVISFPKKLLYYKALKVERKNPSSAMNMLKAAKIIHRDILAKKTTSMERLKAIVNNMQFQNRCDDFRRPKIHSWLVTWMKRRLLLHIPANALQQTLYFISCTTFCHLHPQIAKARRGGRRGKVTAVITDNIIIVK